MILPAAEATKIILDLVQPLRETETVDLNRSFGRILAASVSSNLDFPYWDNSAMDGYAVKYQDVAAINPQQPVELKVVSEIAAGKVPTTTIKLGEAARIFTGAMLPPGADTIIIQENTQQQGDRVTILQAPEELGAFVRRQGEYYRGGAPLLGAGIPIKAPEIAVLATIQATQIPVYPLPRVAIFSTGDELITPEQNLQPGKIVDSNQYALTAFVSSQGAIPIPLGIAPDNRQKLREKISESLATADIVLSTGGVSVGSYDYVEEIIEELGGDIQIRSVAVKPGKPLTVAKFNSGAIYFGIPGNPVSALVSCWRFVMPALRKLSGYKNNWSPEWVQAKTQDRLTSDGKRETYLWGKLELNSGVFQFTLASGSRSSGNLINLAETNALAVLPVGETVIQEGADVLVMKIS